MQEELKGFSSDSLGGDVRKVELKMAQRCLSKVTGRVEVPLTKAEIPKRNRFEQRAKRDADNEFTFKHVEFEVTARPP